MERSKKNRIESLETCSCIQRDSASFRYHGFATRQWNTTQAISGRYDTTASWEILRKGEVCNPRLHFNCVHSTEGFPSRTTVESQWPTDTSMCLELLCFSPAPILSAQQTQCRGGKLSLLWPVGSERWNACVQLGEYLGQ